MENSKETNALTQKDLAIAKKLSPRRSSSTAVDIDALAEEQLKHFSINVDSDVGKSLKRVITHIYHANVDLNNLWGATVRELAGLDRQERIAYFNAKKFLCFQLAKLLDTLQNPFRKTYQSLVDQQSSKMAKGPYPIFDNVTAIFSATPVITRTATYLYACTEWIDDAFQGKEMLLEVYSRLLNPTSVSLANHIVDLECGELANEYMAWNFNSGMAAIDATLSHVLGYEDIVICSRNVYGGTYQLLQDWFGKPSNLNIGVVWFDGYSATDFSQVFEQTKKQYQNRLAAGRKIYIYLESPCNPHGYVLDVPEICRLAHDEESIVIIDSTVATPFLYRPLSEKDARARPDYVIHSYTKDISGTGVVTAGVVIGRNERMFIPKNEKVTIDQGDGVAREYDWSDTLFWNVYYVKGAFLDADKAFEVISGSRTLELRMLRKTISTLVLANFLDSHLDLNVKCNGLKNNENAPLREACMNLGLPAPLFTVDFEKANLDILVFKRFFDSLEPTFGHMVSLGQSNTMVLCPALTSHSEMSPEKLRDAGITPTTVRISVGDEDVRTLIAHIFRATQLVIDPDVSGFSEGFMSPTEVDRMYRNIYLDVHQKWFDAQPGLVEAME